MGEMNDLFGVGGLLLFSGLLVHEILLSYVGGFILFIWFVVVMFWH